MNVNGVLIALGFASFLFFKTGGGVTQKRKRLLSWASAQADSSESIDRFKYIVGQMTDEEIGITY